jgi:hypothetical protein
MAASAWTVFDSAKHKIGNGDIDLSSHTFRLSLHRTSASANLAGDITIFTSVGDQCSGGGYAAGTLAGVAWTSDGGSGQKWDVTDPVFTASASTLSAVRYAVIRKSAGAVTSGLLLCYAALSTAEFNVTTGNTLTIQMHANGVFTLA